MDKEIRKLSHTPNNETLGYLAIGISNRENAKIMAKEIDAVETVLNQHKNRLSAEDREFLKKACFGRVKAAGVVRQKGERCELSDLERFEEVDNILSPSPYRETFFPVMKKRIEEVKSLNKYKEPDSREDLVNKVELIMQADRWYNIRYNEKYKGYLRTNNTIEKNLELEELDNKWIEEICTDFQNELKDEFACDPELKERIDKLREKLEYEAKEACYHRLGRKASAKKQFKQPSKTPDKPKFRVSRTKVGRELRNKKVNKQETPNVQVQGPKPMETWENNAKIYAKSEQQKMIDEFRTKYPEQYNRAMGNIEKEQREARKAWEVRQARKAREVKEAREMADKFSSLYPLYFDRATGKNPVKDNSSITNNQHHAWTLDGRQTNADIIREEEHSNTRTLYAGKSPFGEANNKNKRAPERC
jgi:hypothetical protein